MTIVLMIITGTPAQSVWTRQNSGTTDKLCTVAWTGDVFVIGGEKNGKIIYSHDGNSWEHINTTSPYLIVGIVCPGNGKDIIAVCGGNYIARSSDGITWTTEEQSYDVQCCEIMWDGSRYISAAGGSGGVYVSTDGVDWEFYTVPKGPCGTWYDIAWSGDLYICGTTSQLMYSTDGINWEIKDFHLGYPTTITWTGEKFFLAEDGTSVRYSTDGSSWSKSIELPSSTRPSIKSKTAPSFDTNDHDKRYGLDGRIRWTGKELIHVYTTVCTSPDGIDWTLECDSIKDNEGKKVFLKDIAWNDNMFVAVGGNGTILTSPRKNTKISKQNTPTKNIKNNIAIHTIGSNLYASLPAILENKSVSIAIYNISGKKVLSRNSIVFGNTIEYDLSDIPSGYYTFVAKSRGFEVKKRFLLTR
jgi:hypothetical protein